MGDLDWLVTVLGAGIPGAVSVFEIRGGSLILSAANEAYFSLFLDPVPRIGEAVTSILPGQDPQVARIVQSVLQGDAFLAESWAIPAPPGTYSTGVAYCDWSLRQVEALGSRAVVLLLTDATRRTERQLGLAEEVIRLRDTTPIL